MKGKLQIVQFRCRSDNFGLLVHDPDSGLTASIDTPDGDAILAELAARNWRLSHIFNTHHHYDHVPGNEMLKQETGCIVVGAKNDALRIPGLDAGLADGEQYAFGTHTLTLLETPGHTLGSVCFFFEPERLLFAGDTLFSLGCGRMFEGTKEQYWSSMQKILALPDETQLYCGHEYTLANAAFALEVEPGNKALQERVAEVKELCRTHRATLPVSLGAEKATNPFLRPDSPEIQHYFGMKGQPMADIFGAMRALKDEF